MMDELLQSAARATIALAESDALGRLAGVALRGTVLLAGALLAARCLRGASAAARHLVWSGALGGVLVLLAAAFAAPAWEVPILPAAPLAAAAPDVGWPAVHGGLREPGPAPVGALPTAADVAPGTGPGAAVAAVAPDRALGDAFPPAAELAGGAGLSSIPPAVALWGLYALGAALILARLLVGSLGVSRLARRAEPVMDPEWMLLSQRLARQLGVRRPVTLLRSEWRAVPVTWGVVYPVILLPSDAQAWSAERRRLVLLHELAHVARMDALTHVVTQLAAAALWFNPLVWVAVRRMRAECERACDDVVLVAGERPSRYADDLLDIARTLQHAGGPAFAAWAMARRTEIEGRLLAILDPEVKRTRAGRRSALLAASLSALVALPLAVVQPRRAIAAQASLPALSVDAYVVDGDPARPGVEPATPATPATPAEPTIPAEPAAPALGLVGRPGECGSLLGKARRAIRGGSWRGMTVNSSDDATTIAIADDTSCVELRMEGEVLFTDDDLDVASVAPGGRFQALELRRGMEREIEIVPADGGLRRSFAVNGEARPATESRAWLAELLPVVLRETAANARQRVARIRRQQGVRGVMTLISRTHSDGSKRRYFEELLAGGGVTPDTLRLLARLAATTISSDGDKSAVLRRLTSERRGDAALGTEVIAASRTISSDGDKRTVLQAVLAEGGSALPLADLAGAVEGISSDGDKAAVLMGMPRRSRADDASRRAYFSALNGISSDGDRRRVLTHVLDDSVDQATLVALLRSAQEISSDGDKSAVLAAVSRRHALDAEPVRRAFFGTVNTVSSDGDRSMVLRTVLARAPLAQPVVLDVLTSAQEISSDHDKSAVLHDVIQRAGLRDEAVRARFFDVLKTVSSSSDYRRVMEAAVQQ